MATSAPKFEIPLFDGKINFMVWKSTIEDLLVQQNLDEALEKEKPANLDDAAWASKKKKAVSTIRLAIASEIKYNFLTETDPKVLLEKLQSIYASKSLTNRLCLRWELYQLKMENGTNLQNHINSFTQLVCQLQNADEKIPDQEQALLLLASLPKSYRPIVQTLLVGREKITLDEAITIVRENERMMTQIDGGASYNNHDQALAVEGSERGRNKSRRDDQRSRSKSRPRDCSNVECYYCHEKGHLQYNCPKVKEDLKTLRQFQGKMGKTKVNDEGGSSNVVCGDYDDELLLTHSDKESVSQDRWVLDSAASIHVCRDKAMFDTIQQEGEFGNINMGHNLKVEGMGSVRLRFHDGVVRTIQNVRFVPSARTNLISLGELTKHGHRYVGSGKWCKVYRGNRLVLQGKKSNNNICYLEGRVVQDHKNKTVKRVHFCDEVKVFGDLGRGRNLLG